MKIDLRTIFALIAVFLAIYAIMFMYQYKEQLEESPCELCMNRGFTCFPRIDLYGECVQNGTKWLCKGTGISYMDEARVRISEEANK